ncbi:MAG TPA: heavy metal-associated domain-containing protein [Methylocella sp.]|nr:heavy metal-associated domain-containing protein [Methylocella sp.]
MFFRKKTPKAATTALRIQGMACPSCAERVEKAIRATPGVASVTVDLERKRADVTFSGPPDPGAVIAAVAKAGYEAAAEPSPK